MDEKNKKSRRGEVEVEVEGRGSRDEVEGRGSMDEGLGTIGASALEPKSFEL